jgi:allantoin racemase
MCDAGIHESREMVSIPVIGSAESSMHIAAMLGHRFSVLASLERRIPIFDELAAKMGLTRQLASVRPVNIPVLEILDQTRVVSVAADQAARAVKEDGAHVILFGCTAMAGLAKDVEESLSKQGISGVPVVDPAILVLKIGEALADMGLSHSKRTYPVPPKKPRVWDRGGRPIQT